MKKLLLSLEIRYAVHCLLPILVTQYGNLGCYVSKGGMQNWIDIQNQFSMSKKIVDNQKCQAGFRPLCNKILFQHTYFKKSPKYVSLINYNHCGS